MVELHNHSKRVLPSSMTNRPSKSHSHPSVVCAAHEKGQTKTQNFTFRVHRVNRKCPSSSIDKRKIEFAR